RRAGRGRGDAARVAVAGRAGGGRVARLHDAGARQVLGRGDHGRRLRARPRRLAFAGASGRMTDYVAGGRRLAEVPHTTRATGPASVAAAAAARTSRPASWWGMLILIATEATLFGVFVGTYFYFRFRAPVWPPPGTPAPELVTPIVLAAVLALTAWPMVAASPAVAQGRLARTRLVLAAAPVVHGARPPDPPRRPGRRRRGLQE